MRYHSMLSTVRGQFFALRDITESKADPAELRKSCKHRSWAGRGTYRRPVDAPGSGLSTAVTGFGLTSTASEEYQCSFDFVMRTGSVC